MSKDLNLCQFIGRLGNDVEMRYTQSGSAVANLSIACGDDYKDKQGQKVEQTNWIKVVAFGRTAEVMGEYLKKGSQVYVSGKQVTRKWQAQDGTDRYSTEINCNDFQMLDSKSDSGDMSGGQQRQQPQGGQQQQSQPQSNGFDGSDDIPF